MSADPIHDADADARFPRWEMDPGQTMVEYGLVLVAIALAAISAYQVFGGKVSALVNTVVST